MLTTDMPEQYHVLTQTELERKLSDARAEGRASVSFDAYKCPSLKSFNKARNFQVLFGMCTAIEYAIMLEYELWEEEHY